MIKIISRTIIIEADSFVLDIFFLAYDSDVVEFIIEAFVQWRIIVKFYRVFCLDFSSVRRVIVVDVS